MITIFKKILNISGRHYIWKELKCFVLLILYTAATLLFPTFVSLIIDKGITQKNIRLAFLYSIGMLAIGVLSVIFQYLQQTSFYKLGQELTIVIKQQVYKNILKTNIKYWEKSNVGDTLIVLEEDVAVLENLLTSTVSNSVVNVIVIIGISIFIIVVNYTCGLLVLAMAIIFAIMQKSIGSIIEKSVVKLRNSIGEIAAFTSETLQNANELQASGYEKLVCKKYNSLNMKVMNTSMKQISAVTIAQSVSMLFNVLGLLIVIAFGSYQTIKNNMTVGTVFALTVYVQRLYGPIVSLGNAYIEVKNALPKINKILEVLETPYMIKSGSCKSETNIEGSIKFKNVDFSYNGTKILKNFCLNIQPTTILGITGKNGIGKSTLLKLILNLCNPDRGDILLDNKKIAEYENDFIREKIGYVGQQSFLISGSLKEILDPKNISTENEIIKLMKEFQLDYNRFDKGLNTFIDENHRNLSGGEFQKISLIRSFIEDKEIYLLDEPTATMDTQSEINICNVLQKKLSGKTAIIITHRPRILEICNDILEIPYKVV